MTLAPDERLDELGRKGYRIIQNTKTFCFGIDAVLLADFAAVPAKASVLDLGTGSGILPLLLAARDKGDRFTALEIQPQQVELAIRNMRLNGLENKVSIVEGDIRTASDRLPRGSFDAVVTNPPYLKQGRGLINPQEAKAIARHEILCTLEDVLREASRLLKPGGSLFMVHRCWRLAETLALLPVCRLSAKRLRLVHSFPETEGELFLLEARRSAGEGLIVDPPCVIYEAPGRYTKEVYRMYYGDSPEETGDKIE